MPLRLAAYCGLLAPVAWLSAIVFGGLAQPDSFRSLEDNISDLGALTADHAWIYNRIGTNLTGLLVLGFALGVWRVVGKSITGRIGAGLLVVVGLGMFSEGFLRLDCRGIDAACENDSWHSTAHGIESGITGVGLYFAPVFLAFAFRRIPEWRPLWIWTLAALPATIAGGAIGSAFGNGAASRGGAIVWFAWVALAAAWMLRVSSAEATRSAA